MLYPLPAVLVSLGREGEKPNLITVAWTGTVCTNPPMVYISVRPERYSNSKLKETKTFDINLTTEKLLKAADYCGVRSGRDVDKFKETGLTAIPGPVTGCPMVAESPVNLECKVKEVKALGSHDMFLAEVVAVHVSEDYMEGNGRFCLNQTGLVAYSHGEYFSLGKKLGTFGYTVRKPEESASCVNEPVIFTVLGSRVIWLHSFLAVTSLPLRIACSPYFFRILSRAASSFCCFSFFSQSISKMES